MAGRVVEKNIDSGGAGGGDLRGDRGFLRAIVDRVVIAEPGDRQADFFGAARYADRAQAMRLRQLSYRAANTTTGGGHQYRLRRHRPREMQKPNPCRETVEAKDAEP